MPCSASLGRESTGGLSENPPAAILPLVPTFSPTARPARESNRAGVGRNPLRVKIAASEGVRVYLDCSSPVLGSNFTQPTENPYPSKKRLLGEDMQICISSDCISCASTAATRKRERERRRRVRDLWRLTPLVFYKCVTAVAKSSA
jgi:hypothetical protein